MERNWYAVYTRPQRERKISYILFGKGVETFCPFNNVIRDGLGSKRIVHEPLFSSYIFVRLAEHELPILEKIAGINLVYWMSKPAIIKKEEIEALKSVTTNYINIQLQKTEVKTHELIKQQDQPVLAYTGNAVSIKYQSVKINLPSLGYIIIADRIKSEIETISSPPEVAGIFSKRFNSLFTN